MQMIGRHILCFIAGKQFFDDATRLTGSGAILKKIDHSRQTRGTDFQKFRPVFNRDRYVGLGKRGGGHPSQML